jgi:hypothetical protein
MSFVASLLMIIMIARSKQSSRSRQGVGAANVEPSAFLSSSPYHRIIFGISFSDLLQSLSIALGSFAPPSNVPQALWGIGNKLTCALDGLMFTVGSTSTALYAFLLSFFCLCKVKWSMTNDDFSKQFEWRSHSIIIVYNAIIGCVGLATKAFNPRVSGNICVIAPLPVGCIQEPEIYGECDATMLKYVWILSFTCHAIVTLISLLGIITCMLMVCWHVMITTNIAGNRSASSIVRRCRMEFFIQAGLYVFVFFLTNIVVWIDYIYLVSTKEETGNFAKLVSAAIFPLGGLFNILIYSRPKVLLFRKRHPRCSWIRAFILVVKSGGVVPMVPVENDVDAESSNVESHNWCDFISIRTPDANEGNCVLSSGIIDKGHDSDDENVVRRYYGMTTLVASNALAERNFKVESFENRNNSSERDAEEDCQIDDSLQLFSRMQTIEEEGENYGTVS